MKKCPFCAEEIQDEAIKCKHCGEWPRKDAQAPSQSIKEKVPPKPHKPQAEDIDPPESDEEIKLKKETGFKQCPTCGKLDVLRAKTLGGGMDDWCPHCKKWLPKTSAKKTSSVWQSVNKEEKGLHVLYNGLIYFLIIIIFITILIFINRLPKDNILEKEEISSVVEKQKSSPEVRQESKLATIDPAYHLKRAKEAMATKTMEYPFGNFGLAKAMLDNIKRNTEEYPEAQRLKKQIAEEEKEARLRFAFVLKKFFLDQGQNANVTVQDEDAATLIIQYIPTAHSLFYKWSHDSVLNKKLRDYGFEKVIFTDGHGNTWHQKLR